MFDSNHDVSVLNGLIATTIDSAEGFARSAENAQAQRYRELFSGYAQERRQVVANLQNRVRALGGTPEDDGSVAGALHRRWEDLKRALSNNDDRAVIEEVERGEDHIKAKYESALSDDRLSAETRMTIRSCFESVLQGHEKARELKHALQQ